MAQRKRLEGERIDDAITLLFDAGDSVTTGLVAKLASVSRQAAGNHLKYLVARGDLAHEGTGRAGRYLKVATLSFHHRRAEMDQDAVRVMEFKEVERRDPKVLGNPKVSPILMYSYGVLLNNAIDHSNAGNVMTRWYLKSDLIAFEIEDDGIGAFRNMREQRDLQTDEDALGEIAKGRQSTMYERHRGLGIYFSSRMASRFTISSGQLVWEVDGRRGDSTIGSLPYIRVGTLVRVEVDADTQVAMSDVFNDFSLPGGGGDRTTLPVSLFETNRGFVSRPEAQRISEQLEMFDKVVLDFIGIDQIGQGFADELFRVWQNQHPETRLIGSHTNPGIDAVLRMAGYPNVGVNGNVSDS